MTTPELNEPLLIGLREAINSDAVITALLGTFNGGFSIHTRRPIPVKAKFPMILIGPVIGRSDVDEINTPRPIPVVELVVMGNQDEDYRAVEKIADLLYTKFHRTRVFTVSGFSLIQSRATGPFPVPSDESKVGRRVPLTIELRAET